MSTIQLPLALSIKEACRISSIGRTRLYELINQGTLRTTKVGRRTLVHTASLVAIICPLNRAHLQSRTPSRWSLSTMATLCHPLFNLRQRRLHYVEYFAEFRWFRAQYAGLHAVYRFPIKSVPDGWIKSWTGPIDGLVRWQYPQSAICACTCHGLRCGADPFHHHQLATGGGRRWSGSDRALSEVVKGCRQAPRVGNGTYLGAGKWSSPWRSCSHSAASAFRSA